MFPGFTIQDQTTLKNQTLPYKNLMIKKSNPIPKIVLLASSVITDEILFVNGLFQNILNLYDLFESICYVPIILYEKKPDPEKIKRITKYYRYILPETVINTEIPIYCVIEIGMTCQEEFRKYLCQLGSRFIKLHLGNILNVDIEISTRMPEVHFIHHVSGTYDSLYTSPHYNQNREYSAILNGTLIEDSKIAPYIWSEQIINRFSLEKQIFWDSEQNWENRDIVICEPNLGFQKCFFIPLLIASNFAKKYSEWKGNIKIYNTHNFDKTNNFRQNILPLLQIPESRIQYFFRFSILEIIEKNQGAIFIGHQINNEYNYMTLELMSRNFPILHNAEGWKSYGYYYNTSSWNDAILTLENMLKNHIKNYNIYKSHFETLKWTHSPFNPVIQKQWDEIIKNEKLDLCVI